MPPRIISLPHGGESLGTCNFLARGIAVQTLEGVLPLAIRPDQYTQATCPEHAMRLLSAQGQQIVLPGSTYYAWVVSIRYGCLPQERSSNPSTEAVRLAPLCHVPLVELSEEQQCFRRHRKRFRLCTRSAWRANAQLDRLRQLWLAPPAAQQGDSCKITLIHND